MEVDLDRALAVAREAAAEGVAVLERARRRTDRGAADEKSSPGDLVTEADRAAERAIVAVIADAFPDHAVVAEEGTAGGDAAACRWIVDPLDGTANFVHGLPVWAVSVALHAGGEPAVGVVVDPSRGEWFTARAGRGATLDGGSPADAEPLAVSTLADPRRAILATGFPFRAPERLDLYLSAFRALFRQVSDMRRAGSAAIDLAWVAAGRVEGFWEIGLSPWDIAAGELLVREAGGAVTDWAGGDRHRDHGWIAAGTPAFHPLLVATLREHAEVA